MTKAVYWHKRDLRLYDNEVLHYLAERQIPFVPLYVWEPELIGSYEMAPLHQYAVLQCLDSIQEHYQKHGIPLLRRLGSITYCLEELYSRQPFDTLIAHQEHGGSATFQRDLHVHAWCRTKGVSFVEIQPYSVVRKLKSRDEREKHWLRYVTSEVKKVPATMQTFSISETEEMCSPAAAQLENEIICHARLSHWPDRLQTLGEKEAHYTLRDFLNERSIRYSGSISSPNTAFVHGSRLSAFLAWGCISSRYVFQKMRAKAHTLRLRRGTGQQQPLDGKHLFSLQNFESRLHWREHFIQRIEQAPDMDRLALNPAYRQVPYLSHEPTLLRYLEAWSTGQTGEPLVDACMRCLNATGFINFRMRAMCLSYAIYALHLPWQRVGERLATLFYDYEPGIHWSQVQMQAGVVGINTLRVYSPEKQLKDQDPDGSFVKQWIPELRDFTAAEIQQYATRTLGQYPPPIVTFKAASKHMKDLMYGLKKSPEAQASKTSVLAQHGSRAVRNKKRT
jgi:deoxyribodipyrimidine photo-lyase